MISFLHFYKNFDIIDEAPEKQWSKHTKSQKDTIVLLGFYKFRKIIEGK